MTGESDERTAAQRALMDRARASAERDKVRAPTRLAPRVVAAVLAVLVVFVVLLGFDVFLTAVQKVLEIQSAEPEPSPAEPIPAYVVPEPPPPEPE